MRWAGRTFSEREKVSIKERKERRAKDRGRGDLQKGESEEPNTTVNGIIRFPELRTKSQYVQEAALFT